MMRFQTAGLAAEWLIGLGLAESTADALALLPAKADALEIVPSNLSRLLGVAQVSRMTVDGFGRYVVESDEERVMRRLRGG